MNDLDLSVGAKAILQERIRQIDKYGFSAEYQAKNLQFYDKEQLAYAAHALLSLEDKPVMYIKEPDNWDKKWFINTLKKAASDKDYRYRAAGAFLAAEQDRLDYLKNNLKL